MFKCEECPEKYNRKRKLLKGNTSHGTKEFRIVTIKRKVRYLNQVRFDKVIPQGETFKTVISYKDVGESTGYEIVEEKSYCEEHLPKNLNVKILDTIVERINIVKVKRPDRGEN